MMWKKVKGGVFLVSTFIFAGLFWMQTCNKIQVEKELEGISVALDLSKQETTIIRNERDQVISTQRVTEARYKGALKALTDTVFALNKKEQKRVKDVIAYYKGITKTRIDTVKVPFVDQKDRKRFSDSVELACKEVIDYFKDSSITLGSRAFDSTKDYQVSATLVKSDTSKFLRIDSLIIPDSQHIRFVTTKGGLFKRDITGKRHFWLKKSIEVQVLHTNPLIQVTGQNSAIYIPRNKPKVLEKALLLGIGVFLGTKL